jgi:hypothetical protein
MDEDATSFVARVRVTCPVVEDGQIGDTIGISVSTTAELADDPNKGGWSTFELGNSSVKFECVSEPYNPLWTVRFVPEVEPVETA